MNKYNFTMTQQMTANIVLLGGARRVTLLEQIERIAENNGINIRFYSVEKDSSFYPISSFAEIIPGPKFNTIEFDEFLQQFNMENPNTIFIACMDAAIPSLANLAEKLGRDGHIVAPTLAGAEIALDKCLTSKFCLDHSIEHPLEIYPNSTFEGQVIAKPKQGFGGKGIHIFDNASCIPITLFETHIVQQYISGPETTHDVFLMDDGSFFAASRDRLAVIDGEVDHCIVREPTINEMSIFNKISDAKLFYGPITVQTINSDGRDYLIEINARLGGGLLHQ